MTPEQIKLLREYYSKIVDDTSEIGTKMAEVEKHSKQFGQNSKYVAEQLKLAQESAEGTYDSFESLSETIKNVVRDLNKYSSVSKDVNKSFNNIDSLTKKLKYDQKGISELSLKELKNIDKKLQIESENLLLSRNELLQKQKAGILTEEEQKQLTEIEGLFDKNNKLKEDENNYLSKSLKLTKERIKAEKEIQQQLGLTGAAVDGIVGALGKIGINSVFFDDLKEDLRDAAKSGGALKVVFTGIVGLTKGIAKAITDPLTVLSFLVTQGLKANKQTNDLGKSLGISYEAAGKLRQEFVEYSRVSKDSFINVDRLAKAQGELTEQLGIAVKFSEEELETQARLTELVGLTAEEGGKIAKFSAAAGMTNKDYVASLRRAAFSAMQTTKTHFSDKEILQDISKLSAGILVKFQNNPEAIAAAVVEAKKLGLTLEQVDKIGESLLNWEQSIESELKAELITGRQLNLERARAAALTGNQAELTREIAKEVGSLADFQNMNVIAQKSLAEAFGLSRDEMSEMLLKQEAINKYGSKAAELNAQQIKDMEKQGLTLDEYLKKEAEKQAAQDRFNNAVQKLQDLLAGIVSGPIGQMIEGFAKILDHALVLYPIVGAIGGIIAGKMVMGIYSFGKGLIAAIPKMLSLVGLSTANAVANISAAEAITFGLATIGIIAGIAAAVSAMSSSTEEATSNAAQSQNVKDGIAPASKGPFTITDKFGATAITAMGDKLAVSPNITKQDDLTSGINARGADLVTPQEYKIKTPSDTINRSENMLSNLITTFENTIRELIDSNNNLADRPVAITTKTYLDAKEIGTSLVKLSPKAV
jgi:hypothetical protein